MIVTDELMDALMIDDEIWIMIERMNGNR